MKKLLCIMIISSCSLFAKWHSWDTPPKENQLYMVIKTVACPTPNERFIYVISRYNKDDYKYNKIGESFHCGWRDMGKEDLVDLFNQQVPILFCPNGVNKNMVNLLLNCKI